MVDQRGAFTGAISLKRLVSTIVNLNLSLFVCALQAKAIKTLVAGRDLEMRDDLAQRLLLHARAYNVASTVLFTTKAAAVMLVGVAVKLAMYDPTAGTGESSLFSPVSSRGPRVSNSHVSGANR